MKLKSREGGSLERYRPVNDKVASYITSEAALVIALKAWSEHYADQAAGGSGAVKLVIGCCDFKNIHQSRVLDGLGACQAQKQISTSVDRAARDCGGFQTPGLCYEAPCATACQGWPEHQVKIGPTAERYGYLSKTKVCLYSLYTTDQDL